MGGTEWSVSDTSIITVDENGLVKALKAGSANIYANVHTWDANGNARTLNKQLNITVGLTPLTDVRVIVQDIKEQSINVNAASNLKPVVITEPKNIPYDIDVSSDNPSVVYVEKLSDGETILIKGLLEGRAYVTVRAVVTNSSGTYTGSNSFVVNVTKSQADGDSGGGCNTGFAGLALLALAAIALGRKGYRK